MLNGRFEDNDFTYISTTGRSVIDYICVPYEQFKHVMDFQIFTMSEVINSVKVQPRHDSRSFFIIMLII